jgi:RHS repeat-associated protein
MTVATTGGSTADDGTYLVTWNGHGDALALSEIDPLNGTLTRANRFSYSTWGTPTLVIETGYGDLGFRYRYVGRYGVAWDGYAGAGLLYMRARHYSPEFGRFHQPDPAAAEANFYAYTGNNPISRVDPGGRFWWWLAMLALRIASLVLAAAPAGRWVVTNAPRVWPAVSTQLSRFAHIISRHTWANAPEGASVFLRSTRWESLIQYGARGTFEKVTRYSTGTGKS